jgi:hypothetical protein
LGVVTAHSASKVVPASAVVGDNGTVAGTEKPVPIQLDFILRRPAAMSETDEALWDRQPWKCAFEGDHAWLAAPSTTRGRHQSEDPARRNSVSVREHQRRNQRVAKVASLA